MLLWLLGGVVALVSLADDILIPGINHMIGRDFTNFWVAEAVWAGTPGCAFDVNCFRLAMYRNLDVLALQDQDSQPPPALFIAAPFALMPYYAALAAWTLLGVLFFIWCAKPFLPKAFPPPRG